MTVGAGCVGCVVQCRLGVMCLVRVVGLRARTGAADADLAKGLVAPPKRVRELELELELMLDSYDC